jgi:hypothetical protein
VAEVRVPPEDRPDADEHDGVQRGHDEEGAEAVRPRPYFRSFRRAGRGSGGGWGESSRARASCVRGEGERERESFQMSKRRHYGRRTTSEGKRKPLTVPHGAPQAQDVADRRPHQKHRRRARDAEHRAQQCHLGVPFGGVAGWHRLGR